MHDYRRVGPGFWNGKTGKALKAKGPEAVIVALYLMTCQHSNMLGLYYVHPAYIAVDTGLGMEGAYKGLQWACEAGFCYFDSPSEVVWIVEMAAYQIGDSLDPKDLRCKGVQRDYDALPDNPFLAMFYERYGVPFHMTRCRGEGKPLASPLQAPTKPGTGTGAEEGTGTGTGAGAGTGVGAASGPSEAAAGAAPTKRGTRLERDWQLPKPWGEWALKEYPHWTAEIVRQIATKFRNHWVGKSGKDATKLDWGATWQNWCMSGITQAEHPAPRNDGAVAAAAVASESAAKAARILAARQAGGGAVVPATELLGVGHG